MAEITRLEAKRRRGKCPICGKAATAPYHPFCSKHCADIDLGRWLDGAYRVETEEKPAEGSAEDGAPADGAPTDGAPEKA